MKPARLPLVLLLLAVLGAAQPVLAQNNAGGGGRFLRERPAGMQKQLPPRRDDADARGKRDDGASDSPRRQQLTPEERRQLRHDIHEAGRELYPDRPQRRFQRRQP